ncbi:MAG: MMPL family transporter [Candidatus Kariarchaeaceae archaeon]
MFRNRYVLTILIWLVLILVSIQARELLTEGVESSEEFTGDDTESGLGFSLVEERFNTTRDQVSHIVILDLNGLGDSQVFTNHQWRNYTLYLTFYLNSSLFELGYDMIFSEPILLLAGQTEFAASMVSSDAKYGMINIASSTLRFNATTSIDDFSDHLTELRELVVDIDGLYDFTDNMLIEQFGMDADSAQMFLPSKEDIKSINVVVTGTVANFVDLLEVVETTFDESEIIAVIVVIIILALVFKSPMGVMLPVLSMVGALLPTYLLTFLLAKTGLFAINDFLPSLIAMIGIAVAVDYNLFSMVRYREEYRKRKAKHEVDGTWNKGVMKETQILSSKIMNATAGNAVMFSGFTVMTGFGAMLVLGSEFTIGMALSVSIVVGFSILTARTLTPAILSLFGEYLDWPNFLSGGRRDIEKQKDTTNIKDNFWVRWSRLVMKHAWLFLILGILFLAPFIYFSSQLDMGFNMVSSLPKGTEAREGFEILFDEFDLGALTPYSIVIDGKTDNSIFNAELIVAVNEFGNWTMNYSNKRDKDGSLQEFASFSTLSAQTGYSTREFSFMMDLATIEEILEAPTMLNTTHVNQQKLGFLANSANYINYEYGNNTLVIDITSNIDPGDPSAFDLVDTLRKNVRSHFADFDVDVYVTGFSASFTDSMDSLYEDVPKMLIVAVVVIFLALLLIFRSILLPIKAIITIGGSILFSLGALVLIFQKGYFQHLEILGVTLWEAEKAGVIFMIPVFLFTTILGLGMDYSIFIISRIREEYENGADMDDSVGIGLAKTAGVITSAAAIMTVTFMVFALSPMIMLKMMGFAMAIAIVVDASISRIIILPAAMKLLGEWNWWLPKWLEKRLPNIRLKH